MARTNDPAKTAVWQQRLSDFQPGSLTVAELYKSVPCSVTSYYQWQRNLCPNQQQTFRARRQPRPLTASS
ncbi:MAG TPA: hypothetical protein PKD64_18610 [Pirellulaceae bacterium]|nr:hypothetical protein [Pirellulaceae bacterium]HMO94203.1 hypothetical protein [Pirellulaceae bacterium]HMP71418.1 hypothetical protein [Pirellulaceae bacterium]